MILYHIILAINYIDLGFSKSKKHSSFTDIDLYNTTFKKIIVYLQVCNPVQILKIGFIRNQEAKSALKYSSIALTLNEWTGRDYIPYDKAV